MLYLVRYDELALKSMRVRKVWESALARNIKEKIKNCKIRTERGRIWVYAPQEAKYELAKIFGISSFSPCVQCDLENLEREVLEFAKRVLKEKKSFALRVSRVGSHDFTSIDIARELGEKIRREIPIKVDLTFPDEEIYIEIRNNRCYIFNEIIPGVGGLPFGVEGKVVSLLSGGIDSAVATWMMMKRGCDPILLHLYINEHSLKNAKEIYEILREYSSTLEFMDIEHISFLEKIKGNKYTCILCKREMIRKAERVAEENRAKGIVTGDSLGQVASQTLDNLFVISQAATIPIYRPLIGLDKKEIIEIAKKIGVYGKVSKFECEYAPKYPITKARLEKVLELERCIEK